MMKTIAALGAAPLALLEQHPASAMFLARADGTRLTFGQVRHDVDRRRTKLIDSRIGVGRTVALKVRDPVEFVLWHLAVLESGAVSVPINPLAPDDDIRHTLKVAQATDWVDGDHDPHALEVSHRSWVAPGPGVILLTSGSTGHAKPCGLAWPALMHTARHVVAAHRLTEADCAFSPLPLFHINALVVAVLGSLLAGSRLVLAERFSASAFWGIIEAHDVTWVNAVPSILNVLAARTERPSAATRLRFIRSASAPLPEATRQAIETRFHTGVVETYGMTEAASQITASPLPNEGARPGSVGLPHGIELRVVDRHGAERLRGVRGMVEIRGPSVIRPDWGPNSWVGRALHDDWYPTGDLGRVDQDGFLYLEGRIRDIINRGGENIFPRELEEQLLAYPGVIDAAVVGRPHPILGEVPVAFVVPDPKRRLAEEDLRTWMTAKLARYKLPSQYIVLDELPKGRTGKTSRPLLRRLAAADDPHA